MNVFELFAVLTLQKDDYNKGLDDTENKTKNWATKVQGFMQSKVVSVIALIIKAIVDVSKKLAQLAQDSLNYADNVGDLAAKFGVTTDAISEMQYIADQSSTSVEQLTTSMSMLYMRAKQDGEAFKQLGISVTDNNGNFKAMDELFWETVGALNNLEDEGAKSSYMLDLFGRSAMNVGEVLRKDADEIARMRQEAHDLGIVLDEETANFASDWNDKIAVLKLQGKSVIATMVAGGPEAEEMFENYINNILETLEEYFPSFLEFGLRFITYIVTAILRVVPSLIAEIIGIGIDMIGKINWHQLGFDIGKSVVEGIINVIVSALNFLFRRFNVDIKQVDFGPSGDLFNDDILGGEYEISESIKQDITVKVEASGDTAVSEETAEMTAQKLAPYIDKILGGV